MKRTKFNRKWLKEPSYASWIKEDPLTQFSFKCSLCSVSLELGNMGRGSVERHMNSVKHRQYAANQNSGSSQLLISWANVGTASASTNSSGAVEESETPSVEDHHDSPPMDAERTQNINLPVLPSTSAVESWAAGDLVLKSEILWSLQTAMNHISHRSNRNTSCLFKVMFSDSVIAQKFTCGSDKDFIYDQSRSCSVFS